MLCYYSLRGGGGGISVGENFKSWKERKFSIGRRVTGQGVFAILQNGGRHLGVRLRMWSGCKTMSMYFVSGSACAKKFLPAVTAWLPVTNGPMRMSPASQAGSYCYSAHKGLSPVQMYIYTCVQEPSGWLSTTQKTHVPLSPLLALRNIVPKLQPPRESRSWLTDSKDPYTQTVANVRSLHSKSVCFPPVAIAI